MTGPESAQHEPVQHEPAQHEPAQHEPAQHEPAQHEPVQHEPAQHEPAQHAASPKPGDLFEGRYRIMGAIGKGGFAQVYRARQEDLDRDVAIKILTPASEDSTPHYSDVLIKRFHQEARLISKLRDPHTITMFDYGQTDSGLLYLVLEFVHGISLSQLITSQAPLPADRVFRILVQTLMSLQEAHDLGVLHRDIKPANIMTYEHLGRRDHVKLLDFGIAKVFDDARGPVHDLTTEGILLGTANYMSPEQILGRKMSPASDLYSLGLVAYELIVGKRANDAPTSMDVISRQIDPEPFLLPESMPIHTGLRRFINRLMDKHADRRFQTAQEAFLELERIQQEGDRTLLAPSPSLNDLHGDEDQTFVRNRKPEFLPEIELDITNRLPDPEPDPEPAPAVKNNEGFSSLPILQHHQGERGPAGTDKFENNNDTAPYGPSHGLKGSPLLLAALAFIIVGCTVLAIYLMSSGRAASDEFRRGIAAQGEMGESLGEAREGINPAQVAPLEEQHPSSTLRITTAPPGLSVFIDDKLAGLSPVEVDLHGFTFPATISARLHADASRMVVLTRPSEFVHLDFSNQTADGSVPVQTPSPVPVPVPVPVQDSKVAAQVNKPSEPATRPDMINSSSTLDRPARPAKSTKTTKTSPPPEAPASPAPETEPVAKPVKPEAPSGFSLPALDNFE